jgi:hypothetical protein
MSRKWLLVAAAFLLSAGAVFAQNTPPLGAIGSFEAGDFRALAVTADGDRLLVADAENQQVRVYNFSDPAQPTLQSSLDISGSPVLLAGGENYGLVAVTSESGSASLEAVAPALPSPNAEYLSGWGNIDIGSNPRALALSPDGKWGFAISDIGFTVLQINGVGDIGSIPVEVPVLDAALSNTTAYVLGDNSLHTIPLGSLSNIEISKLVALEGTPSVLALNQDTSQGVYVLDGSRLVFFNPETLEPVGEFTVEGAPITSVHYLNADAQYLVITQQDSRDITVLDTAAPQNVAQVDGALSLENPITALTVYGKYVVATDGVTIQIFSA